MALSASDLAKKLSDASVRHSYTPEAIPFPDQLDLNNWFTSPEMISLYGQPEWEAMTEEQRKKLSFHEAVNFYSLNIHGEKALIQDLARLLYDDRTAEHSRYIHHFIDEENKHMTFFGTFCMKYAGKVYADRKFGFPKEYLPGEQDFWFFLRTFVFEEIVDDYNLTMSKDDRLHPLAKAINHYHHVDEARHLAYGRACLKEIYDKYSSGWGAEKLADLPEEIRTYMLTTWREYYNPDIYEDAGVKNAYDVASRVFDSEIAKAFRARVTASCINYLVKSGIVPVGFKL